MRALPGDDLVPDASWVIDRSLAFDAGPAQLWPWLVQLGKDRAGWYLPRGIERLLPARRRGARAILPQFQHVSVGDDSPDWGPGQPVFRLAVFEPPRTLVYLSLRDRGNNHRWPVDGRRGPGVLALSWALVLESRGPGSTLHIRLRVARAGRRWGRQIEVVGGLFDWLTIAGLHRGLRERLDEEASVAAAVFTD
ncbi:MAG: hypothetical protein M3Y44_16385 [Actinomycetota bacterium]|nr:hypothetical protein [Actinomycetota bacterium]